MDERTETRRELENIWRERVTAAKEFYSRARAEAEAALESCGCDATSIQIEILRQAQSRESAALEEYMRVLRICHDFLVGGVWPSP